MRAVAGLREHTTWAPRSGAAGPVRIFSLLPPYTTAKKSFRLLAVANLVLLPLAMATFGEPYAFWVLPLSDLGVPHTPTGAGNAASFIIFTLNMCIGSATMVTLARMFARSPGLPHGKTKLVLCSLAAAGFLIGVFPHEPYSGLHTAGCGVMIGSLWGLANLFSWELRTLNQRRGALRVQLVLQLTILPYAACYLIDADIKQGLQKVAIAGLLVALTMATGQLRESVLSTATERTRPAAS